MNLIEAIRSGKPFRNKHGAPEIGWYKKVDSDGEGVRLEWVDRTGFRRCDMLEVGDLLSDDWILEPTKGDVYCPNCTWELKAP